METVSGYTFCTVSLDLQVCALLEIATVHSERFKLAWVSCILALMPGKTL